MIRYPFELSTTQQNHVGWLNVRQNDTGTQQFVATITTNDVTQDLTGLTAEFRTRQNNENVIIEKASITNAKDGVVEYVVSQYAMQQLGKNIGYFTFSKDDVEMFSTKDFCYYVNTSVTTFGLKGCDYIWRIEDLIEYVKDLANQAEIELNKVSSDVEVIQKQIDDMFALIASQGVLSANEVKKLMSNFQDGNDIEVTVKSDFIGKIAGSVLENGNILKALNATTLYPPSSQYWVEGSQYIYDLVKKLDGEVYAGSTAVNGQIRQMLVSFDVLFILEQNFPLIFEGAVSVDEKVAIAKRFVVGNSWMVWTKGSGPSGDLVTVKTANAAGSWVDLTNGTNTTNTIKGIGTSFFDPNRISSDGKLSILVHAEGSNGTIPSSVSIDYANVELKVKFNIRDFIPTPRVLNAKDYGIKGDGVTNDTAAIQALINRMNIGDTLYFFPGTFMIDATAAKKLIWKSNINIEISPQATLKVISNNAGNYELFDLSNLSNIRIYGGGRLLGERSTHTGTAGEWGMGVMMKKSANIKIEDIQIDDFWGDGIYIGGDGYGNQSKNIYIKNVHADNNRRQGFSVVNVDGLIINGGSATRTNGTAPESGIDFEPNNNGEMLRNITISNFTTSENAGGSMLFAHAVLSTGESNLYPLTDNQISIRISNLYSYKDARGPYLTSDAHTVFKLNGFIEFNNTTILEPLKQGVWFNNWREEHMAKVRFNNLSVTDVNSNGLSQGTDAVAMLFSSGGTTDWATETNRIGYSGVSISNLSVIDTRATQKTEIGVRMICEAYQLQNAQITNYDTNLPESKKLSWLKGRGTIKYINETGYKISSGTQVVDTVKYFGQTLMTQNGNGYLLPPSKEHVGKEIGFRIPIQGAGRFPVIRLTSTSDSFTGCGVLVKTTNGMVLSGNTGNEIRFKSVEDDQWLITYLGEAGTFKQQ